MNQSEATSTAPIKDAPTARETVRLTNVYATDWTWSGQGSGEPVERSLQLGRLSPFYEAAFAQMPAVLARERIAGERVRGPRMAADGSVSSATAWLFLLPSGQVVAVLTIDVPVELGDTIDLLEDGYYAELTVDARPLASFLQGLAGGQVEAGRGEGLLSERHQIAFARLHDGDTVPDDHVVQQVIYRSRLPYRREFSAIVYPAELNRRPTTVGAVGPYVSVIAGHQDYLENAVFLSAVQTVAAAAKLHEIRDQAYLAVRSFRQREDWTVTTEDRRRRLGQLAESLSDLELELSFSVEAVSDFGLLVPSLRAESYHDTLYTCMSLGEGAETVARMLERLERSIAAEATSVESLERRADEQRRVRWTVAVGFLTTTAAPLGLLFAFFGINAVQVDGDASMVAARYLWVYLLLLALVLTGVALFVALLLRERRDRRREASNGNRSATVSRLLL